MWLDSGKWHLSPLLLPSGSRSTRPYLERYAERFGLSPELSQRVLVVGAGNSGAEIALDLWESGAQVAMSVRSPVHVVPRDLLGIPAQVPSLLLFSRLPPRLADRLSLSALNLVCGDLSRYGLRRPDLGPVSQVLERGRVALIDIGTAALIKQGTRSRSAATPRGLERGLDPA